MPPKTAFRFLADEMIHHKLLTVLRNSGCLVRVVPKGLKNGEVFRLAIAAKLTLLTQDKDFSDSRRYPPADTEGIVCICSFPPTLPLLTESMRTFLAKFTPADIKGKLVSIE